MSHPLTVSLLTCWHVVDWVVAPAELSIDFLLALLAGNVPGRVDEQGKSDGNDPIEPKPVGDDGAGGGGLEVEKCGAEESLLGR